MNRRTFLGLTGLLVAARGFARPDRPPRLRPKKLVLMMQNNGTQQANFWPQPGSFTSPILDPIVSDARLAARTIAVKGVFVPRDAGGTDGNEHDMGFARMWTGAPLLAVAGHPWGGAPSVDQLIAQARGASSLALAVYASEIQAFPKPGFQHRRSFSYVAPGVHKVPTLDPFVAYSDLFWGGEALTDAARHRLKLRQSALDLVSGDLSRLRARLGGAEAQKLDAHADALRTVESRLSDRLSGRSGPGATCGARGAPPRDFTDTTPDALVSDESLVPELVRDHLDLVTAALACNLTSVATLQIGYGGGHWRAAWGGVGEDHHDLAHKDTSDAGSDPAVTKKIVSLNRWYASQIAYLAQRLDAIPDGDGTLLDHTLIVWSNEFGRGDHSLANVPIVFVGGRLAAGARVVDAGPQTFQCVGTTVLRAMGLDVSGFGDLPTCGPLAGV